MTTSILVTGGAGYVGAGLLRALLADGRDVTCVDRLSFGGESLLDIWHRPRFRFHRADITDIERMNAILKARRYDAVIHLAAIVGDPACAMDPLQATRINLDASKWLIDRCKALGIERFVFASTCSNYGKMSDATSFVDETSPLAPVSLYAELKVAVERYLLDGRTQGGAFCPTALRFATVYGPSPRMRFDLTVNEFTKELALGRELVVFGEQFWRPYCHVRDFARAFMAVLDAPRDRIANEVFNVGDTTENYTKRMLVELMRPHFPHAKVTFQAKAEDPRDYRVNCDKIRRALEFTISTRVPEGIAELADMVKQGVISNPDDPRYYNIPHAPPK
jgi:nucleoside-diphosphate-sugar epimerase